MAHWASNLYFHKGIQIHIWCLKYFKLSSIVGVFRPRLIVSRRDDDDVMCVGVLQRARLSVEHVERRQATANVSASQDGPVSPATVGFS